MLVSAFRSAQKAKVKICGIEISDVGK